MPGGSRSLPSRPSLRYLKLEAKRRVAAGEFPSLHEAQGAIAWEHGLPNWATLKQHICAEPESPALDHLRWVISRFAGAAEPGWTPPADAELRLHFDDHLLTVIPPPTLIATISKVAADLHGEVKVLGQSPLQAYVQLGDMRYLAAAEAEPPHRLTGLRGLPTGSRVRDPRVADPPVRTQGPVPPQVPGLASQAFAELGLTALLLAGGEATNEATNEPTNEATNETWILTQGWADLDRAEPLGLSHRFPAPGVTVLVTTTAVLMLVADGKISLDSRANDHLRSVRLADDTITVRELLTHTAGVDSPTNLFADEVPDLKDVMGPVIACTGPRGTIHPSNGGCAVLGQLVEDVTGLPYAKAAERLVLRPLGLKDSSFPARSAEIGPGVVTGYNLTLSGMFEPIPARIPTLQAVGGLWATGADLVRLGLGWSSLLPEALAHEALSPQTSQADGGGRVGPGWIVNRAGLGWIINERGDLATQAGGTFDATASLTTRIRDHRTHVVLTNRLIPVNSIETQLAQAWTNPS
jgi:CubicO group peptidase (beta-lactamase class C family)